MNLQCERSHFKEPLMKGRWHPLHCPHRVLWMQFMKPEGILNIAVPSFGMFNCMTMWPPGTSVLRFAFASYYTIWLHLLWAWGISKFKIIYLWSDALFPDLSCLRSHCCVLPLAPRGWPMSSITVWGSERLMSIEDCHGHMIRAWSLTIGRVRVLKL